MRLYYLALIIFLIVILILPPGLSLPLIFFVSDIVIICFPFFVCFFYCIWSFSSCCYWLFFFSSLFLLFSISFLFLISSSLIIRGQVLAI
uniref:Putative ovule protein n=1 Tax=Solanum chacoense TaxID=4108 RepID=A0A0V0H2X7_SOLCH